MTKEAFPPCDLARVRVGRFGVAARRVRTRFQRATGCNAPAAMDQANAAYTQLRPQQASRPRRHRPRATATTEMYQRTLHKKNSCRRRISCLAAPCPSRPASGRLLHGYTTGQIHGSRRWPFRLAPFLGPLRLASPSPPCRSRRWPRNFRCPRPRQNFRRPGSGIRCCKAISLADIARKFDVDATPLRDARREPGGRRSPRVPRRSAARSSIPVTSYILHDAPHRRHRDQSRRAAALLLPARRRHRSRLIQ